MIWALLVGTMKWLVSAPVWILGAIFIPVRYWDALGSKLPPWYGCWAQLHEYKKDNPSDLFSRYTCTICGATRRIV